MRYMKKVKNQYNKSNDKKEQTYCVDCDRPTNQHCHNSDIMNGKCGKCYRMNYKENERRTMHKIRTKYRKNQRTFKFNKQTY